MKDGRLSQRLPNLFYKMETIRTQEERIITPESLRDSWIGLRMACISKHPPESGRFDQAYGRINEFKIELEMADILGIETTRYRKALEKIERVYDEAIYNQTRKEWLEHIEVK